MTEKFLSVVGDPVEHSLSPLIHSIAYQHLGLDWTYERNRVQKGQLESFIAANPQYEALSVTMPLKDEAFALSTQLSPEAERTRVVNTLHVVNGLWFGANTDVFGISQALSVINTKEVIRVAILGSGATARSALRALQISLPESEITVYSRSDSTFFNQLARSESYLAVRALHDFSGQEHLVINTTPVDLSAPEFITKYWMNVGYSNKFASPAQAKVISPLEMLLWQAIAQIRIFLTGDETQELTSENELVLKLRNALDLSRVGE